MNSRKVATLVYDTYTEKGFASARDEANKHAICGYEYCNLCDCESPVIKGEHTCLVCGNHTVNELKDELDKDNI